MNKSKFFFRLKQVIDNLLLINLFLVIAFAFFFAFSIIMQFNDNFVYIVFFKTYWNPIIVPLISLLIMSSIMSGVISWLRQRLRPQEEDI